MKKLFSLLTAILFAGTMMAITYQHIFTAKPAIGDNKVLSGVSWTIAATNLNNYNSQYYAGVQIGSSKASGQLTLTSSDEWGAESFPDSLQEKTVITEVRLWLNSGGSTVTPSVTIGGKDAVSDGAEVVKNTSAGNDYSKATKVTFTPAEDGKSGVVVIDVQSEKAGYVCAIEIDCEEAAPSTDPVIKASNLSFGEVIVEEGANYESELKLTVKGENLSAAIEYKASSEALTLSGELTAEGGELTVGIAAPAGDFAETITLTSGSASKVVNVSGNVIEKHGAGTESDPYDCATAAILAKRGATDEVYVKGYANNIGTWSSENKYVTFWLADEKDGGKVFELYRAECLTESAMPSENDLILGHGKLSYYSKNSISEFEEGCTFQIVEKATSLSNPELDSKAVKIFENGQLIIIKNGVRYNALGAQL